MSRRWSRSARELDDAGENLRHLLVHCHAGISRSTAAMATLLARHTPLGEEEGIFARIREIRPIAWPNSRMVDFADDILGRGGRLSAALREHYRIQAPRARTSWTSCAATGAAPRCPIAASARSFSVSPAGIRDEFQQRPVRIAEIDAPPLAARPEPLDRPQLHRHPAALEMRSGFRHRPRPREAQITAARAAPAAAPRAWASAPARAG